jgi:hypothetical protein
LYKTAVMREFFRLVTPLGSLAHVDPQPEILVQFSTLTASLHWKARSVRALPWDIAILRQAP